MALLLASFTAQSSDHTVVRTLDRERDRQKERERELKKTEGKVER